MTENIHPHDFPESERSRGGGFTIWFTGLSGSGKSTITHILGPGASQRHMMNPMARVVDDHLVYPSSS